MGFVLPFQARLVVRNSSTLVKAAESNKRIMTKKGETKVFMNKKDKSCYLVVTMSCHIFLIVEKKSYIWYLCTYLRSLVKFCTCNIITFGKKTPVSSSQNLWLLRWTKFAILQHWSWNIFGIMSFLFYIARKDETKRENILETVEERP